MGKALAKKAPPGQTLFSNFLFFQPLQEDFDFLLFVILNFFSRSSDDSRLYISINTNMELSNGCHNLFIIILHFSYRRNLFLR
jgi:hypothetical protein